MTQIYCTVEQLSRLFRIDYSALLDILHKDVASNSEVKRFGRRYLLSEVVAIHNITVGTFDVSLDSTFLNLYEVQQVLASEIEHMVYSTVLRKTIKGEIPALKFGDTYRVPKHELIRYLKQKRITYRKRKK